MKVKDNAANKADFDLTIRFGDLSTNSLTISESATIAKIINPKIIKIWTPLEIS